MIRLALRSRDVMHDLMFNHLGNRILARKLILNWRPMSAAPLPFTNNLLAEDGMYNLAILSSS